MKAFVLPLLLLVGFSPLAAQSNPPGAPGPQPPQVEEAVKKYQGGDLKGAIAVLEPLKGKPGTHPAALSLLGALYLEAGKAEDSLAILGPLADGNAAGPVILHNAARAARALGQTAKAEAYLERAVTQAPVSPASRELGILRGSQGRIAESYRLLRPWALANPGDYEARLSAAYGAVELDRPPEAEELLKDLPQDHPAVQLLRGRVHLLKRDPAAAVASLEPLLKGALPTLDLQVRRYLAESHLALGQSSAVIGLLQDKTGKDSSLALLLARAHYQSGDPAAAAGVLQPFAAGILAQQPTTASEKRIVAEFALEYGQALVGLSKWTEAIAALEVATRFAPESLPAWQLLARAQLAAGRREDATRSTERFSQLRSTQKPNSEKVTDLERGVADPIGRNLEQAASLAAAGRSEEALALIRQEISLAPNDPRPRAAEVTLLLAAKRPQDALNALEGALKNAPGNPDLLHMRGTAHMALYQIPAAEKDFRQVLQAKPDHVDAMNELAALLMTEDRNDEARQLLRRVLELRPGDEMATANLKSLEP